MHDYIVQIERGRNLSHDEITVLMELIMAGQISLEGIKRFLEALNKKGPTVEEITACALIMRKFVLPVHTRHAVVLDVVGTGGDQRGTFNISTVTAIVTAACGVAVAKHGNRRVSSRCGSADVLEKLGVKVDIEEKYLGEALDIIGLAFLFAQRLHPAMKNVAPARQALGVRTIFNILGPLTNPAMATHQVMGVYNRDLVDPMAQVLKNLGLKRALVVHGNDGLDEITTTDVTFVSEFTGREIISYDIDPTELGLPRARIEDLAGGDADDNAAIVLKILEGGQGPRRDIVLLNAAYALYTVQVVENLTAGINMAAHAIDSGRALQKLEELEEFTSRVR
ncbi:MAG: anthranilate phosphoribosyltransferase [Candidatus Omnitrophica bacterium]|nr:anthranilate phosphoribosyltransferase [Candidatus Omnitrophota bacterium]MDE2223176.1 anthranilate phosphoribosyltransferase [Candidatus Omnitrophota bacterium]